MYVYYIANDHILQTKKATFQKMYKDKRLGLKLNRLL